MFLRIFDRLPALAILVVLAIRLRTSTADYIRFEYNTSLMYLTRKKSIGIKLGDMAGYFMRARALIDLSPSSLSVLGPRIGRVRKISSISADRRAR